RIDQCCYTEEQHCERIATYCKISNCGNQQNCSGENLVLRCELSQLFPIEEDQAACNKIHCTVQNVCPCAEINSRSICNMAFIKEISFTQPVKHQCRNRHTPRSLLVSNQEAEEREQHVEHKDDCQCPTHTNDRNLGIRQK